MLLAEFTSKRNESNTILGAVCDVDRGVHMYDSTFSDHAADLVCQQIGYTSAENWGSHEFNDYVNAWEIHDRGIKSMIQGMKCSEDATNISECGGSIDQLGSAQAPNSRRQTWVCTMLRSEQNSLILEVQFSFQIVLPDFSSVGQAPPPLHSMVAKKSSVPVTS